MHPAGPFAFSGKGQLPKTPNSFGVITLSSITYSPTGQSETMTVSFGPASVTTPILNAFTAGFDIAVDPDGSWHHHPFFELNGPASDGVYLIPLQLRKDGFGTSLPVWILWGQNADEATADAAYAAASATIPNPGTLAPLAVAALAVRRRRPR